VERDEVLHAGDVAADAVHSLQVIAMGAHDLGAAVVDDVREVGRREPEIDRHEHGAGLRHGVEGLELRMRVRGDVRHPIALPHAESLQPARPAIATREELLVGEPKGAVHDPFPVRVQAAGAASELDRCERGFHDP
jgi:hypothetical protein